jgi:uncharacterized membrane protein YheB (UPF0754 family)
VKTLLFFAIPPLAGALIGFVTNVIAIRMLFRPLRELRVCGIRIPFTPGILPRQRRRLAESIGAMVERELLTPELLRQRLRQETVRAKAYESLARFTAALLERPLGDFCDPARMEASIFGLLGPSLEARAADLVEKALRDHADHIACRLAEAAGNAYPEATAACIELLRGPGLHRKLETQGRIFLAGALLKLNVFQRLFLSAAQYDRTLDERMGEIIDDLIDQLESLAADRDIRTRILDLAAAALNRLLAGERAPLSRLITELVIAPGKKPLGELLSALGLSATVPLGTLLALDGAQKQRLDELLCARLFRIADEQIENALRSINIRTLVSERIDSLEMLRVERIILDVMADQLKWIDVFGAILGFIIGLVQVLSSWLLRSG